MAAHHVHDGLAREELEDPIAGDDEEHVIWGYLRRQDLWVCRHADLLCNGVPHAPGEGRAGVHAVLHPQPGRIAVVVLLLAPALDARVLDPLHLVHAENPGPAELHPLVLVLPERGLIGGEILRHHGVPVPDPRHRAGVPHIGDEERVAGDQDGDRRRAAHGVVDLALAEIGVGGVEGGAVRLHGVVEQAGVAGEDVREPLPEEAGALGAELAVAVEDGEQVQVRVSLELRLDDEAVLVLPLRGVRVVAALREGGVLEEEAVGGDGGGSHRALREHVAAAPPVESGAPPAPILVAPAAAVVGAALVDASAAAPAVDAAHGDGSESPADQMDDDPERRLWRGRFLGRRRRKTDIREKEQHPLSPRWPGGQESLQDTRRMTELQKINGERARCRKKQNPRRRSTAEDEEGSRIKPPLSLSLWLCPRV